MVAMFIMCISYSGVTQDYFSTTLTANDYIDKGGIVKFNDQPIITSSELCNGFIGRECTYLLGLDEDSPEITYLADLGELELFDKSIVADSEKLTVAGLDEDKNLKLIQFDTSLEKIKEASHDIGASLGYWVFGMTEFSGYYVVSIFKFGNDDANFPTLFWYGTEDLSFQGSFTMEEASTSFQELSVDNDNNLRVIHQKDEGHDVLTFNSDMELIDTMELPDEGGLGSLNFEVLSNEDLVLGLHGLQYLIRYDSDGTEIWKVNVAEAFDVNQVKFVREIKEVSNGGIMLCGSLKKNADDYFGFIYMVNSDGEEQWKRLYKTQNGTHTFPLKGFVELENEGFLFYGALREEQFPSNNTFHDTHWVLKTDQNGCIEDGCGEQIITSVDQPMFNHIILSPNPVVSDVEISGIEDFTSPQFKVVDIQGRVIMDDKINKDRTIDLSTLSSGIYFMHVIDGKKVITIQKFIKS